MLTHVHEFCKTRLNATVGIADSAVKAGAFNTLIAAVKLASPSLQRFSFSLKSDHFKIFHTS